MRDEGIRVDLDGSFSTTRLAGGFRVPGDPVRIWAYVSDHHHDVDWRHGLVKVDQTPAGPLQVGTVVREVLSAMPGLRIVTEVEVVAVEAQHRYAYRSRSGPLPVRGSRSLTPRAAEWEFHEELEVTFPGWWRLLAPVGRLILWWTFRGDLKRLRWRLLA